MEKEELKHLAKLLRAFRDDSVDQDEYEKRDDLLFDVRFEFEAIGGISCPDDMD